MQVVELISGGAQIAVTNENKMHYLNLLAQYRLATQVRDEVEHFLKGKDSLSHCDNVAGELKRASIEPNSLNDCRLEWTGSRKPACHIWWERVGGMCAVYNESLLPVKETLGNSVGFF